MNKDWRSAYHDAKRLRPIIAAVAVAVALTFAATTFIYYSLGFFSPRYEIPFNPKTVSSANVKKFDQVRGILKNRYYKPVNENNLLEGAIAGMADSLGDPYTVYFTKKEMDMFKEDVEGSYIGIGVSITMDTDGLVTVIEPFPGSPAYEAGVKKGDKVIKVDGKDVTGIRDENLIVGMIRGKEGTAVNVTFYRPSLGKPLEFTITRRKVKIDNISFSMLEGGIGYIDIKKFDAEISGYFQNDVQKLLALGLKGLVIDVRDDPGGYYEEVVSLAGMLLPKGSLIVYTEDRNKKGDKQYSKSGMYKFPVVVLVNGNSASASEILAGAIRDCKRGLLIGTKTFGKGVVQVTDTLADGSGLKYTISRYFTPKGICIQGVGIKPDIEVQPASKYKDFPVSQIPRAEDRQLAEAIKVLKTKIK